MQHGNGMAWERWNEIQKRREQGGLMAWNLQWNYNSTEYYTVD